MRALAALEGRARAIDRWTALLAAIGALGAALVLLRTAPWGPEVDSDSTGFVAAARNLLAGDGFLLHHGGPYYPEAMPGFPLTLAFAGLFGPDPLDAAGWLHAAAFGLTVFVTASWVRSRTESRFLAVWAGLACALSPSLGGLFSRALTGPLFVLYAALSLFVLDRYLAGGRRRSLLLAAALCAGLACATRYIGFALVASAVPMLLLAERRGVRPSARGIAHAAIFAAVALALPGAWMLHNLLTIGKPAGPILPTGFSPLADLHTATGEFARWTQGEGGFAILEALLGGSGEPSIGGVLALAAAPLALLAGAGAALALSRGDPRSRAGLAAPAAFLACYAAMLAVVLARSDAALYPRYLAPMYPPLLAAAAIVLGGLLRRASRRGPLLRLPRPFGGTAASLPALALAAALALWLPQQAAATWDDVRDRRADGRGYTSREWAESATIRYLQAHPPGVVWSNNVSAIYFLVADLRAGNRNLPQGLPDVARVAAGARAGGAGDRFVRFNHGGRRTYGPADLAALPDLEVEAVLEDGVVLRPGAGPPRGGTPLADRLLDGARLLATPGFALHLDEARNRLVYVRDGCAGGDAVAPFFLEAYPADPAVLPAGRRSASRDFWFGRYGFREAGRCLAVRDLPGFAVAAVRTGQRAPGGGEAWSAHVPLDAAAPAAALDPGALATRAGRLAAAPFEVYLDGDRLVYAREGCAEADVATRFFLHVAPRDPADLPEDRRGSGFANLDFWFRDRDYVYEAGGRCVAARELPAYPIASIRTGQWVRGEGELWSAEAAFGE